MNSLEYIENQILSLKESIQYHKDVIAEENDKEIINNFIAIIKKLEEELQTLQQIKVELEAWEAMKDYVNVFGYTGSNGDLVEYIKFSEDQIPDLERIEKVKKALEIKDKGENK